MHRLIGSKTWSCVVLLLRLLWDDECAHKFLLDAQSTPGEECVVTIYEQFKSHDGKRFMAAHKS